MAVKIHSMALTLRVFQAMESVPDVVESSGAYNGLLLLKNHHRLVNSLSKLQSEVCDEETENANTLKPLVAEMALLVHGLLNDEEILRSYGLSNLHRQGYLRTLQGASSLQSGIDRTIEAVKDADLYVDEYDLILENPELSACDEIYTRFRQDLLLDYCSEVCSLEAMFEEYSPPSCFDINKVHGGATPLIEAVRHGHRNVAKTLIDYQADIQH
ncbi:unnamed protein product [Clonostachys byssicola]|uniref:Uncharacterized protein n=1 Tax=Clonostachys byssicola TaxID=160290 RepID=A0A9N9UTF5_9HYPO|nr:unnamed protein product [Clonostachys byssicola]